jgi:hypothetical protein
MRTLSPWEAQRYFKNPAETTKGVSVGVVNPLCDDNPMRVGLIFATPPGNASPVSVSMNAILTISQGIAVSSTAPLFMLSHNEWGVLVQRAWYAASGGAGTFLTVIELILRDWPIHDPDDTLDVQEQIQSLARQVKALVNGNKPSYTIR